MTLREHLRQAARRMEERDVPISARAADSLMMFTLGCDRAYLSAHPERALTDDEATRFLGNYERRATGEPLQYITGRQEFRGLEFRVSPAVLIPRPETEHLVEAALKQAETFQQPRILDVGTGSGCIALALAHELAVKKIEAEIHAVDISEVALQIAKQNASHLKLEGRVQFMQSDLLAAFAGNPATFDLVVSNPPYVGRNEADKVQREVREHEPAVAVFGGEDGMDIYKRLIPQAFTVLKSGGWLLMEIGYSAEAKVHALLTEWKNVETVPDLQGIPRVVMAQK